MLIGIAKKITHPDALSFYYEHKSAFDERYKQNEEFFAQIKKKYISKVKFKIG